MIALPSQSGPAKEPAIRPFKDISGQKFGRLTVLERFWDQERNQYAWICQCECGNTSKPRTNELTSGRTVSCGCLSREKATLSFRKHGMNRTKIYGVWCAMKRRCYSPAAQFYSHYGGRGIKMCDAWKNSFQAFYDDMGPRPSDDHSVERIDNNGNYEPGNCRWATRSEQSSNTRVNHIVIVDGKRMTITQAARSHNIHVATVRDRLRRGLSIEQALLRTVK